MSRTMVRKNEAQDVAAKKPTKKLANVKRVSKKAKK